MSETKLANFSIEDLELEIRRRKRKIPLPIDQMNWTPVVDCIEEGINALQDEGFEGEDFEGFVFEAAMEVVYGKDVWKWYSDLLDGEE